MQRHCTSRFQSIGRVFGLLGLFCFAALTPPANAADTLRIAAVVNDEVITVMDVIARADFQVIASGQQPSAESRRALVPQVLRQLIDERLQLQEMKTKNIEIPDEDVLAELAEIENSNKMAKGAILAVLDQANLPHETVLQQLRARLGWQRAVIRRMRLTTQISDEDIDDALVQLRESAGKPESLVSEIFVSIDNPELEAEARANADRLVKQAREGTAFGVLAREFSDGASAAAEGDIGWIRQKQLDPVLDAALSSLEPGQVSEPIRTARGFYILAVRERRIAAVVDPLTIEVKLSRIDLPLAPTASQAERDSQTLLAQQIAESVNGCPDFDLAGREMGGTPRQTRAVRMIDLPVEMREMVAALPVGKASAPLPGERGIEILMVCQRSGEDGLPSREQVRQRLTFQRLDAQGRRYLRDLRQAAFVDIRQ